MPSVTLGRDERGQRVTIGDIERRSGLYVLGKPGMGKSALLVNMMLFDVANQHSVFFLDPHGDAITDFLRRTTNPAVLLLDPEDETHSFGINLLSCANIQSLRERTETYTRAYNVFYKLWEDQFGPWLQLILQNTLWAFIENQEYTLAEVPMFLNPRNTAFRNHIINNMQYNPAVVDFWKYEFFQRRERDQQERVDAALTRIVTLLTHPYVRHIIGQKQTTIGLDRILSSSFPTMFLCRLSANLASDIKKFIGTILVSELLYAVRDRPEDERHQYCIYVDEFQNYATADDFRAIIAEGRKFGVATTVAHQERFGQFADNQKLLGATLATANKVFFQLTVKDAEELAAEFASQVEPTERRREQSLVISPHPVEDIWERGHPEQWVMDIRNKYFWIVDLIKRQEEDFLFDPTRGIPHPDDMKNEGKLHWNWFTDWHNYRVTKDMLRKGLTLLNKYYYDCMTGNSPRNHKGFFTEGLIEDIIEIIKNLAPIYGWYPFLRFNETTFISSGQYLPPRIPEVKLFTQDQCDTLYALIALEADSVFHSSLSEKVWLEKQRATLDVWNRYVLKEEFWTKRANTDRPKIIDRALWQITDLQFFLFNAIRGVPLLLQKSPVKITSSTYDETLRVERTQQDLVNEKAIELARLPRFMAYAKVIEERDTRQSVWTSTLYTNPLPREQEESMETEAIERGRRRGKERVAIEAEIRERQEKWRKNDSEPPEEPPQQPPRRPRPPTRF